MPYAISNDNLHGNVEFLFRNFERADGGWKAYKIFGSTYMPDDSWKIEAGSTITTELGFDVCDDCSWGINVANNTAWLCDYANRAKVWEMFIPDEASIVIPWETDGKIRTDKAVIIKVIGYIDYSEFYPAEHE